MNFNNNGWFFKYLDFRDGEPLPLVLPTQGVKVVEDTGLHNDLEQSLYYFLQPTGLLYGALVAPPFPSQSYPAGKFHDSVDRLHLSFLESLFAAMVADRHFMLNELVDEESRFNRSAEVAFRYFLRDSKATIQAEAEAEKGFLNAVGLGKNPIKQFEKIISEQVIPGKQLVLSSSQFYNAFLFLELYNCLMYQRNLVMEPELAEELLAEQDAKQAILRETLLQLIIIASGVDGEIEPSQKNLIEYFIKSSNLPRENQRKLREAVKKRNLEIDSVDIPEMPWIIRRYFLETLMMVVLADRFVSEKERAFLEVLVEKLGLWQEEMNQSQAAMEIFLMNHKEKLPFLGDKSKLLSIRDRLQERSANIIRKNLEYLTSEIKETKELYDLLMKSSKEPLSLEEKIKVREQIMDILKSVPTLAIFALPGGGVILPVLIKLLPFNLLPSSFEE